MNPTASAAPPPVTTPAAGDGESAKPQVIVNETQQAALDQKGAGTNAKLWKVTLGKRERFIWTKSKNAAMLAVARSFGMDASVIHKASANDVVEAFATLSDAERQAVLEKLKAE